MTTELMIAPQFESLENSIRVAVRVVYDYSNSSWHLEDVDGNQIKLAPAPQNYQSRKVRDLDNLKPYQLTEDEHLIVFIDPITVSPVGWNDPGICSIFGGNTRYLLIEKLANANLARYSKAAQSSDDSDLETFLAKDQWNFSAILLEFMPNEILNDPAKLMAFCQGKNTVAKLTSIDRAEACYNASQLLKAEALKKGEKLSEDSVKKTVARILGLSTNGVYSYLKTYEIINNPQYILWTQALEKEILGYDTLLDLQSRVKKFSKAFPDVDLDFDDLYKRAYDFATFAKGNGDLKITVGILKDLFESLTVENSPEPVEIVLEGEEDDLELSDDTLEKERIKNLTADELPDELAKAILESKILVADFADLHSEFSQFVDTIPLLEAADLDASRMKKAIILLHGIKMKVSKVEQSVAKFAEVHSDRIHQLTIPPIPKQQKEAVPVEDETAIMDEEESDF